MEINNMKDNNKFTNNKGKYKRKRVTTRTEEKQKQKGKGNRKAPGPSRVARWLSQKYRTLVSTVDGTKSQNSNMNNLRFWDH